MPISKIDLNAPLRKVYWTYGFLPVFTGRSKDSMGHAKGPFIRLPVDYTPAMLGHEIFHAMQWYVHWFIFGGLAGLFFLAFTVIWGENAGYVAALVVALCGVLLYQWWELALYREAAAYGKSLRIQGGISWLDHYAKHLSTDKRFKGKISYARIRHMIHQRYRDGKLY